MKLNSKITKPKPIEFEHQGGWFAFQDVYPPLRLNVLTLATIGYDVPEVRRIYELDSGHLGFWCYLPAPPTLR